MNIMVLMFYAVGVTGNIYLARKKNRSVLVWILLGWYTYFLSTFVLLFLKPRSRGVFNIAPFVILWPFLLIFCFANLPLLGVLFSPVPPEVLAGSLWTIAYGWFLVSLWRKHRPAFSKYLLGTAVPLLFAGFFSFAVTYIVRQPFRDGVRTIHELEEYKKQNGRYPSDILELNYPSSADYSYDAGKDAFGLICRTGLFESAFYDSKMKRWKGDLPVGGVPYDIIGIDQL